MRNNRGEIMYSLNDLHRIDDEYEVDEVNCLEKPVALLLHSFNPVYRNLYLLSLIHI